MKIKNILVSTLSIVACAFLAVSCSENDDFAGNTQSQGNLSFNLTDGGMATSGLKGKSTVDETMKTAFEVGDKAGVFAVKDGLIANNINNLCVKYNANGFWDATESIAYSSDMEGMTFYAYYPYDEAIEFDPTAADPFATAKSKAVVPADQSTKAKFNAADFMTSGATTIDSKFHAVTANLQHVFSLAKVNMPNVSYSFDNASFSEAQKTYVISQATDISFTLGTTTVKPYFDNSQQSYYLIVTPQTTDGLTVKFKNNGNDRTLNITDLNKVSAGQYALYNVDGGVNMISHTLAVGDFYTTNGYIFSPDDECVRTDGTVSNPYINVKDKIIGVVYSLGTGDEVANSNASWIHAQVIAVQEGSNAKWGTTNFSTTAIGGTWFMAYGLQDAGSSNYSSYSKISNQNETGYSQTLGWRKVNAALTGYCNNAMAKIDGCETDYPSPASITTGWYIPGNWDWKIIFDAINASGSKVNSSIKAANGTEYAKSATYASSDGGVNGNRYRMYRIAEGNGNPWAHLGSSNGTNVKYRFVLGF